MAIRPGAGFIIFRKFRNGIKFLGLKAPEELVVANKGIWDIPKGTKEPGESDWDCAVRETLEEAGIVVIPSDLRSDPFEISSCVVYLVETDSDPYVTPNPSSGILEHEYAQWLAPEELEQNTYIWLKPFVSWAREVLAV